MVRLQTFDYVELNENIHDLANSNQLLAFLGESVADSSDSSRACRKKPLSNASKAKKYK